MLRRRVPTASTAARVVLGAARFAVDTTKVYDHSASFSRALSESEQVALDAQKNRTVSAIVPGKLFMRHFLAGEQATISIYNRGMSVLVTFALILGAGCYAGLGANTESVVPLAAFAFFVNFLVLHTHMNSLYGVCIGAYLIALAVGY